LTQRALPNLQEYKILLRNFDEELGLLANQTFKNGKKVQDIVDLKAQIDQKERYQGLYKMVKNKTKNLALTLQKQIKVQKEEIKGRNGMSEQSNDRDLIKQNLLL